MNIGHLAIACGAVLAVLFVMHFLNRTEENNPVTEKRWCPMCRRRLLWHGPFKLRQELKLACWPARPHTRAECESRLLPVNDRGNIIARYEPYRTDRPRKPRRTK